VICYAFKVTAGFRMTPFGGVPVAWSDPASDAGPECPLEEKLIAYRQSTPLSRDCRVGAWAFHNLILSKIEDKIPGLGKVCKQRRCK